MPRSQEALGEQGLRVLAVAYCSVPPEEPHSTNDSEAAFHTGWFIESLAAQTLVLFVICTLGNPLRSRPSKVLIVSVLLAVVIGVILPASPLATDLASCCCRPSSSYS